MKIVVTQTIKILSSPKFQLLPHIEFDKLRHMLVRSGQKYPLMKKRTNFFQGDRRQGCVRF